MHVYKVRARKDRRGVDLISDALIHCWGGGGGGDFHALTHMYIRQAPTAARQANTTDVSSNHGTDAQSSRIGRSDHANSNHQTN